MEFLSGHDFASPRAAAGYPGMYGSPGPTSTQPPMGMVPQQQGMMVQQEMTVPQGTDNCKTSRNH